MNFQQIRAFHLVAQEGSVRRAAEVLGISQPTVSQHLKGLETRNQIRLFDKRGRGLGLTEAGIALFDVTKRLLATAGEIEDMLQKTHGRAQGRSRVASDSPALAVRIVAEMLRHNPEIEISIRKDSVAGITAALQDMRADVGIAVEPPMGSALQVQPLRREELLVCLPADSPLALAPGFDLAGVGGQVLISREEGSRTRALVERTLAAAGVFPARVIEIEGGDIGREAVAHGLGLSFFAQSECPPDPRIAYRPILSSRGQIGFVENLILRRDRRRVPEIVAFLAAAQILRA